eukprot:1448395-Rhodomonas_salina.1
MMHSEPQAVERSAGLPLPWLQRRKTKCDGTLGTDLSGVRVRHSGFRAGGVLRLQCRQILPGWAHYDGCQCSRQRVVRCSGSLPLTGPLTNVSRSRLLTDVSRSHPIGPVRASPKNHSQATYIVALSS